MKKKGLIISTVVMVVVLIASLTTATYAWFSTTGSATITDINFSVTSASDLVIGVKTNNTIASTPAWSDFYSDNTTFDPDQGTRGQWTGDTNGLGMAVNTGLDLSSMQKAVYSFSGVAEGGISGTQTTYTRGTDATEVEVGFDVTATALKASGNGNSISDGTYAYAVRNTDYLDVVFGVAPATNEVLSFGCLVTIKNTSALSSLGMNAAIHVAWSTDGTNFTEYDVYGLNRAGDAKTKATKPNAPNEALGSKTVDYTSKVADLAAGDATVWIPLDKVSDVASPLATGIDGLKQLHLIVYICGPDSDCVTGAAGAATISIEFLSINKGTYDAAA